MTEETFSIAAGRRAPLEARRRLDTFIEGYPPMLRFDARLCLTELVTNAVEHAGVDEGKPIAVAVRGDDRSRLRLDVRYSGPGFVPGPRRRVEGAEKGRGLALVEAVSDSWGAASDRGHVWVELADRRQDVDGSNRATSMAAGNTG